MNKKPNFIEIKKVLDEVSPSFCIAKWKQVTLHLHNGHTHSCHHPTSHKIPLDELKNNITALHNTSYKKLQRKMMLEGQRPQECDYCWRVEDSAKPDVYSDRVYKSGASWAMTGLDEIKTSPWDHDINPSYVEVSFGNTCNFKCSYCGPNFSSSWMEEIQNFGPYKTKNSFNDLENLKDQIPIPNREYNPYIEAFWKWWPNLYSTLKNFRITGGEPLLNKNTFQILDFIIENPNPNLELAVNTNLNPPKEIFEKFIEKVKIINEKNCVKNFKIFTSAEAYGKQAEYIRFGLNYDTWIKNLHRIFEEIPNAQVTIMSTYNFLSIFSYEKFLKDILELKQKVGIKGGKRIPLLLDIPYLRYPQHQSVFIMESKMISFLHKHINFMKENLTDSDTGFNYFELDKLLRIREIVKNNFANVQYEKLLHNRKDFIIFVEEHDLRRGTNFLETFPEMVETYKDWKRICI
jgi:organic radical activating enzyme